MDDDDGDRSGVSGTNNIHDIDMLGPLRSMGLFKHLDVGDAVKLLSVMRVQQFEKNAVVVHEGQPGDCMYAIVDGELEVTRAGAFIVQLVKGMHFGELALLNGRPRSATVHALQRSRVLVLERPAFHDLIRADAKLGVKLLWMIAQVLSLRLDDTTATLSDRIADRIR